MPIEARPIAVKVAVALFFICALVGWANDLAPEVCCKRGLVGAFAGYVAGMLAMKIINMILVHAIINSQIKQNKGTDR